MNLSEVEIANLGLGYVGQDPILSFDEKSNAAAKAKLFYPLAVAEVLRAAPWHVARTFRALGLIDITTVDGWTYAYSYPSDCLRVRYLGDPTTTFAPPRRRPRFTTYTIEGVRFIMTHQPEAVLVYTTDLVGVQLFTPDLVDCIAWKLAEKLALPLTRTAQRRSDAQAGYRDALSHADTLDANEEYEYHDELDAPWVEDRMGPFSTLPPVIRG